MSITVPTSRKQYIKTVKTHESDRNNRIQHQSKRTNNKDKQSKIGTNINYMAKSIIRSDKRRHTMVFVIHYASNRFQLVRKYQLNDNTLV